MSIQAGQQAPNFKLFNTDKKEISLSDYREKNVLVLFFPLAFTSVCTTELCSVRDNIATYNNMNAVVLGISIDTAFTLGKFKEEQKLNFDLLSDFNKEASVAYGCLYKSFTDMNMKGVSKRSAFVIDKVGTVRYAEVLENAGNVPDFQKINETLKSLN